MRSCQQGVLIMNAAGIDVSSRKSTVAVLRPFGEVVHLPFDVAHSTEGLASLSKQLKALLEQSFPGIRKCFDSPVRSDGTQKWVDFAHTFWHVDCVRKQSYNAFSERYQKWCKRHGYFFKQSNAEEVYALAKNAVALVPKSGVTKVLVSFYFLVQDVLQSYRTGAPPRAICLVFAP